MTETLKKNDIVKVDETGKVGRITDIQYAFNRYLFKNVSGWQYGIDGLSKVEIDSLITTIESLQKENEKRHQLLCKLDSHIDFSEHLDNGDWGIEDASGINGVFDEVHQTIEKIKGV